MSINIRNVLNSNLNISILTSQPINPKNKYKFDLKSKILI